MAGWIKIYRDIQEHWIWQDANKLKWWLDIILMAKRNADGVYDSDPRNNPNAKMFKELEHKEVLQRGLGVMDSTATSLCMDNKIPIIVFSIDEPGNILKAVLGYDIGTIVGGTKRDG